MRFEGTGGVMGMLAAGIDLSRQRRWRVRYAEDGASSNPWGYCSAVYGSVCSAKMVPVPVSYGSRHYHADAHRILC